MTFTGGNYRRFLSIEAGKTLNTYTKPQVDVQIKPHGTYGELLFEGRWKGKRLIMRILSEK